MYKPAYRKLYQSGKLTQIKNILKEKMRNCTICPNNCKINRLKNEKGLCNTGRYAKVASYSLHFGEETPISYKKGSGTIFFSNCNLSCQYCQNYNISQLGRGNIMKPIDLAHIMIELQNRKCHNINLVSPTHVVFQIIEALIPAIEMGLKIPIIYNTNSYDSLSTLKMLNDIIDIYLPDLKYMNNLYAEKYSKIKNYTSVACSAIKEMYKQVGPLFEEDGTAKKGTLVRLLILPNNISETKKSIDFLSHISNRISLNIMDQYHPVYNAKKYPNLNKKINKYSYFNLLKYAKKLNLNLVT